MKAGISYLPLGQVGPFAAFEASMKPTWTSGSVSWMIDQIHEFLRLARASGGLGKTVPDHEARAEANLDSSVEINRFDLAERSLGLAWRGHLRRSVLASEGQSAGKVKEERP